MNITSISGFFSGASKFSTNQLIEIISKFGVTVTERWASLLLFFLAGLIVYIGIKVAKPILKYTLIIIGIILILGLFIVW